MKKLSLLALFLGGCAYRVPAVASAASLKPPAGGDDLRQLLLWSVVVSIFGLGLGVATMVWLPTKRIALGVIALFGTTLAVALSVKTIQPYLPWFVGAGFTVLLGAIAYGLRNLKADLKRTGTVAKLAVAFGYDMSRAQTDADADAVKDKHAELQAAAGVKDAIDGVLARVKATV